MNIPEKYEAKAKYCFNILSQIWGIPLRILRKNAQEKPNIVYALNVKQVASDRTVFINFDEEMYNPRTVCDLVQMDDLDIWIKDSENPRDADIIGGIYRLITFMDESQVKEEHRDRRGIFNTNALPLSRKKGLQIPLIENHAYYLLRELIRYHPYLKDQSIPRWPNGKKYVISITHDTDAVNLGSSKEILTNLTKAIVRRDKTHFNMFRMGISHASKNKLITNPLFGFSNWKEYEAPRSIRSCFYLSTVPKTAKIDINDCKSSVTDPNMNWDILKEMVREGWEFGLHASINTKFRTDSFIQAKNILEEKLGAPIYGLRHHYWALDWLRPYITFRKHVNAGFRYDTSIAWRDAPGFRAATCLPFQPFDPYQARTRCNSPGKKNRRSGCIGLAYGVIM